MCTSPELQEYCNSPAWTKCLFQQLSKVLLKQHRVSLLMPHRVSLSKHNKDAGSTVAT